MFDCRKTVNDMYKYAREEDSYLLSSFGTHNEGFHFWDEYLEKHRKYDKLFNRMFNSFKYFMQDDEQTIAEITEDFTDEVYNHLMINAKKYEELYRINVINDENYSITDNYDITETMEKEIAKDDTTVMGQRSDSDNLGQHSDTNTHNIGAKTTTTEDNYGQKQTTLNFTKGTQTDSQTDDIAGFNSTTYAKDTSQNKVSGQRTDNSSETESARKDNETISESQQTITDTSTMGSQLNTHIKGEQTDSFIGSHSEEYVLTRRGNIGVRTVTEVLDFHRNFWNTYEFYTYIFKEICAELLSI